MITQERLKVVLDYNSDAGVFTRLKGSGGYPAGHICSNYNDQGYLIISVDGRKYRGHRLAWLYMFGVMPTGDIDHINQKPDDNRIVNLRDVSHKINMRNARINSSNTSGVSGVSWYDIGRTWRARINVDGKEKNLGHYKIFKDAVAARKLAELDYEYHENHGRTVEEIQNG